MNTHQLVTQMLGALEDSQPPYYSEARKSLRADAITAARQWLTAPESEAYAWEYTNVQSGLKQLQPYPPQSFLEWNDMEMWNAKPLFTHPASKPEPLTADEVWKSDAIMAVNASMDVKMNDLMKLVRAIEQAVWEKCRG